MQHDSVCHVMTSLARDIRFALRSARRSPGFTVVALVTLAVGIGAATATFSVANAILLRPLPVHDQDRVLVMWAKQRDFAHVPVRWAEIDRYARETRAFELWGNLSLLVVLCATLATDWLIRLVKGYT